METRNDCSATLPHNPMKLFIWGEEGNLATVIHRSVYSLSETVGNLNFYFLQGEHFVNSWVKRELPMVSGKDSGIFQRLCLFLLLLFASFFFFHFPHVIVS